MPAPYSTLADIYTKIRRLTRSPSTAQISDNDLNDYVNTFILFDMPQHLRLFDLRREFVFYTTPFVDQYSTNTTDTTSPLFNFKNKYVSIHEPLYIAGFRRFYSQSREQFFGLYPQVQSIQNLPVTGDGVTMQYIGTITGAPLIRNQVQFNSIDATSNGLVVHDVPFENGPFFPRFGNLVIPNQLSPAGLDPNNFINYITGAFTVTFATPPAFGANITSQTVPSVAALPQAVLFYDDVFTVRPIPDQVYKISLEAYVQPSELFRTDLTLTPDIRQWSQYIAYGAARKVFQDRLDMESLSMIEPEYKKQEVLVQRKTILENTNTRTSTIFTEGNANWPYGGWGNFGSY